jgi:hypothetical protein
MDIGIMNILILVFVLVNLVVVIIFGSLYYGTKSMGLLVPDRYIPIESVINMPMETRFNCLNKEIRPMNDAGGIPLNGEAEARMMHCTIDDQPIIITAVYWKNPDHAQNFWSRYYRQISRHHIRKKAFRNNLWVPKFVTGRYGSNAPFDITAWYQDNWFFFIGISTRKEGYNQLKGEIRNQLINHIKSNS